ETEEAEEGCLSLPGTYYPVTRATMVKVRAQGVEGAPIEKDAEGFLARIFQHEIDHLDGILFIDRLTPELRKEAMKALRDQDFGMSPPPRPKASKTL
ncbi:MAG TPA: peptide deformylase, partial [Actinomycetota bacterium]|nr:peptide deformylase [Actinomycetota bacterium]